MDDLSLKNSFHVSILINKLCKYISQCIFYTYFIKQIEKSVYIKIRNMNTDEVLKFCVVTKKNEETRRVYTSQVVFQNVLFGK